MSAIVIDGRDFAKQIQSNLATEVAQLKARMNVHPCLCVCLVGGDPASCIYVRNKRKACENVGIASYIAELPADVSEDDIIAQITQWNKASDCHGILVQLPLPKHVNNHKILNSIDPNKDVDGFHSDNLGKLVQGDVSCASCTPLAVMYLLKSYKIPVIGKHAVIINDTIVVGKPLAMLLNKEGATVTLCNHLTENISEITKTGDILVSAVGKRDRFLVKADMVKSGAAVIDVGITRCEEGRITGDVDFDEVSRVAGWISPVPGGVGPLTISMLLRNTVKLARKV